MRMRVETPEGVLVIYDATSPPQVGEGCSGYLAYWLSTPDMTPYVFPAVLHEQGDLVTPLLALERDLGVDIEAFADTDDRVDGALRASAEAPNGEIVWEPATLRRAVEIMGFDPGDDPDLKEPGDDQTASGSPPMMACQPCPMASLGPPGDCGSPVGLARGGLAVAIVCCPDGGPPPGPGPGPGPGCTTYCCLHPCECDPCCVDPCSCDPCCVDPCSCDPCCADPCSCDPACCGDPCCNDRCCQGSSCCHSPDPCCDPGDHCCGNPDRGCNPDNPCDGSVDPNGTAVPRCSSPSRYGLSKGVRSFQRGSCIRG